MTLAHFIGTSLVELGVRYGFGVVGSGNFHLTRAFDDAGGTFIPARHEGGAATMADAYARASGEVALLSVHQGCGYTNALTGIAEAAKSRTPLIVAAPCATLPTSNFFVDQSGLARGVGARAITLDDPESAGEELSKIVTVARQGRETIVLNLPIDSLDARYPGPRRLPVSDPIHPREPTQVEVDALVEELQRASRPVFIAGRGARQAGRQLEELAAQVGALVATSAVAAGLFGAGPWDLGIAGGFSSPASAELIADADLIVGWGCALNMWTTRHGHLIAPQARVVQVDDTPSALGAHRDIHLGVHGDVGLTAAAATRVLRQLGQESTTAYRTPEVRIKNTSGRFSELAYDDWGDEHTIDPRTLTRELNAILPRPRIVSVDSGNFMGYPSVYFDHDDENSLCFTQAFQSIGLGLATSIGASLAHPKRLGVAALGDGGAAMAIAELETVARLDLPMCIVVYNDSAYSAEVHHFADENHDHVRFNEVDFAAIARGFGLQGITVEAVEDLAPVKQWVRNPTSALVIDAKVASPQPAWWLAQAFGH